MNGYCEGVCVNDCVREDKLLYTLGSLYFYYYINIYFSTSICHMSGY